MRVIGIEFNGATTNYVVIEGAPSSFTVENSNRLALTATRSREALIAFQDAVTALYNSASPDLIAIKEKPESGGLRAGAAALKMEGIAIASAPCPVEFISGVRINQCGVTDDSLFGYLQPALKAAVVAMTRNRR